MIDKQRRRDRAPRPPWNFINSILTYIIYVVHVSSLCVCKTCTKKYIIVTLTRRPKMLAYTNTHKHRTLTQILCRYIYERKNTYTLNVRKICYRLSVKTVLLASLFVNINSKLNFLSKVSFLHHFFFFLFFLYLFK